MFAHQVIAILGGTTAVARQLGISSQAVSLWIRKDRIPAERVPSLERVARIQGLPLRAEDMRADVEWSVLRERH